MSWPAALIGEAVEEITESGAPTGDKVFVCYNPPVVNPELGIRAPYLGEAAKLALRFLKQKIATIVFAQSRLATEVLLTAIKSGVADKTGDSGIVRGYRGGYLPTRRRAVEQGLREGEVLGVVSTNALELGVDIGHLDVAVLAGYPGAIASLWQQAGRAGRRTGQSAAVLVATSAPLDQFMMTHPEYLFGTPPEHARVNPNNPFILVNHLKCAAFELPIARGRAVRRARRPEVLVGTRRRGVLHHAGRHWHWASETYPADHIVAPHGHHRQLPGDRHDRARREANEASSDHRRGRLGQRVRDDLSARRSISWRASRTRFRSFTSARTRRRSRTSSASRSTTSPMRSAPRASGSCSGSAEAPPAPYLAEQGEVLVAEKVVGFKKIKMGTLENVGSGEVELPQQEMQTTAAWITVGPRP